MAGFPQFQIGGPMGFLDEWGETLLEKGQQAVKSTTTSIAEAVVDLGEQVSPKDSKENNTQKTEIGGQTEINDFNSASKEAKLKEEARVKQFQQQLAQKQNEIISDEERKKALAAQRENVIKTVGGISNASYEDVMDENGRLRTDIETWFNKKNSEMAETEVKNQKQNQVAQGINRIAGADMKRNFEDQNMNTPA